MTLLRNTSLSVILTSTLVMGACSNKDKGPSAEKSAPAAALGLKAPSDKVFAKHFDVPTRNVTDAEGQKALGELNLLTESGDALSWDKTSGSDGNYTYTNLSAKDDDGEGELTIAKAELVGVHMNGDIASFDRADFSDIQIYDETEGVTVKFDTLSIARPTPDMAKAIMSSLQNIKGLDDLDFDEEGLDMGFGALGISGAEVTSKELTMEVDSLMWGEDKDTSLTDFKVQNVTFAMSENADAPISASLKSFSGTGLRGDMFEDMQKSGKSPTAMMGGFNPLIQLYSTLKMEDLNFDSNYVSVTSKGFEGKSSEKGGVTTQTSVGDPFIIKLKDAPTSPQGRQAYEAVKSLGFDEIVLQSSQTTILDSNTDTVEVKDGNFSMKDGFELSYNYGASGVKAMTDKMQAQDADKPGGFEIKTAMEAMTLNGFQMRLEDKSIVERSLKLAGEMRGASPDQVKKELKVALAFAPMMANGLEGEMLGEIAGAFGSFVDNGGTLSIVIDPKEPLPMSQLADYKNSGLTMEQIGFTAKAE